MEQWSPQRLFQVVIKYRSNSWVAFSFLALMVACYQEHDKSDPAIDQNQLSFAIVHEKIFRPRCLGCHGHDWCDTYQGVKKRLEDIERVAIREQTMPKGNPLSPDEMELLKRWIQAGAPENPQSPVPSEEPLKPTFESIKKRIFVSKCITCHCPGQSAAQVPLETKDDLINSPRELVLPGNPGESGLIISLTRSDDKRMPPPPTSPLSKNEVEVVHRWILEGAN